MYPFSALAFVAGCVDARVGFGLNSYVDEVTWGLFWLQLLFCTCRLRYRRQLADGLLIRISSLRCCCFQVLEQGSWLAEYYVGAKKTFYSVEFSPNFHGMTFDAAVVYIFELFEVTVTYAISSKLTALGAGITPKHSHARRRGHERTKCHDAAQRPKLSCGAIYTQMCYPHTNPRFPCCAQ